MTAPVLELRDAAGSCRTLIAGGLTTGFLEAGHYTFVCTEDLRLVVDDIELPRAADGYHWSPGFYAGQVEAELLRADGETVARYRLDVSPSPNKLGQDLFEVMLRDLLAFAPDLLLGNEAQQALFNPDESPAPPEVQYVRLRHYAQTCCQALQRVCERPLTRLAQERRPTPIHRVRRLDVRTAQTAARSPFLTALASQSSLPKLHAPDLLDAPVVEDTLDNDANRTLAWMLSRLQHRASRLSEWLNTPGARGDQEFQTKRVRRSEILHSLQKRLRRIVKREPFRSVTRRVTSGAGLIAIAAHPAYARAQRYVWLALQDGFGCAEAIESLPISPTWQVYERWCYLCTTEVMRELLPGVQWKQTQWGTFVDQLRTQGRLGQLEFAVWLQPRFAPWDHRSNRQFNSLSGERFPDIVVSVDGPAGFAFMVLDAKYRANRSNLLNAMMSAHLYNDSLTWRGKRPWRALLVAPRTDQVAWLAEPAFHEKYCVGALPLARRDRTTELRQAIAAFIGANGGSEILGGQNGTVGAERND